TGFFVGEINDGATEATRVVSVLSRVLASNQPTASDVDVAVKMPAELLVSSGYELIVIYDATGKVHYATRSVEGVSGLPHAAARSLFRMTLENRPVLIAGAIEPFTAGSSRFYLLVGDLINDDFLAGTTGASSLHLQVFRMDGVAFMQVGGIALTSSDQAAAARAIERLRRTGEEMATDESDELLMTIYAPMKDAGGELIAVVRCGLRASERLFEHVGRWPLFLAIFLFGTLGSVLMGAVMPNPLVRPANNLTPRVRPA